MTDVVKARLALLASAVCFLLAACSDGGPDSEGNNDTMFTGFSLVIVIVILGLAFWFYTRKKRG